MKASCRKLCSTPSRVIVALSGGVDSSVAAALAKQQTSNAVQALHMTNWNTQDDDSVPSCTSEQEWRDAQQVAAHLNLPITRQHLETAYWNYVFEPFVERIQQGMMGNPDIDCNVFIKFGALRDYCMDTYGPDVRLVTGHYARLWHREDDVDEDLQAALTHSDWLYDWADAQGRTAPLLLTAVDHSKDQTYFLAGCSTHQFSNVRFPLGNYYKTKSRNNSPTVRELASAHGLPTASKRDSMGICFVGKRKDGFRKFISEYLPTALEPVCFRDIDTDRVVGRTVHTSHASLYAIGQGVRISGASHRYFCVDHELSTNTVWVGAGTHHPALYADRLELECMEWMGRRAPPGAGIPVLCRIRHLQPLQRCEIHGNSVLFESAVRGIAAGQMAVLYDVTGVVCLGGSRIASRGASYAERGLALNHTTCNVA